MVGSIWIGLECFDFKDVKGISKGGQLNQFYSFTQILWNNAKNFIGYMVLYPIYPILFVMDFISTEISIMVSISTQGLEKTLWLLVPHGIIEMPNFIIYTYMSAKLFYYFYKEKKVSIKSYWQRIAEHKKRYFISFAFIVWAAIIEGLLTPALYRISNV
jgi:uncharacterized membrane protein SpoIIM required for sporulation